MADFIVTLLTFFLVSVVVISIALLVALCVLVFRFVKMILEDAEDGK